MQIQRERSASGWREQSRWTTFDRGRQLPEGRPQIFDQARAKTQGFSLRRICSFRHELNARRINIDAAEQPDGRMNNLKRTIDGKLLQHVRGRQNLEPVCGL